jgi:acetyltransferase-like isoleucine patch superfamily enzyme
MLPIHPAKARKHNMNKQNIEKFDIKKRIEGQRNVIIHGNSTLTSVTFDIQGDDNHVHIGNGCLLNGTTFFIRGNRHKIDIGPNCRFNHGVNIWFEDHDGNLTIGRGSTFENVHIAVTEPDAIVKIGNDCMFAYDIDIRTGDSHSIIETATGLRINHARNIHISDHVWIAPHCIILKGVSIEENSVVATGSVVVKSEHEKSVILAGNPARVVKRGITWSRERIYAVVKS